jgi:hypothetical protein
VGNDVSVDVDIWHSSTHCSWLPDRRAWGKTGRGTVTVQAYCF